MDRKREREDDYECLGAAGCPLKLKARIRNLEKDHAAVGCPHCTQREIGGTGARNGEERLREFVWGMSHEDFIDGVASVIYHRVRGIELSRLDIAIINDDRWDSCVALTCALSRRGINCFYREKMVSF